MSGKKIIHCLVTGLTIKHFSLKLTSEYFSSSITSRGKASQNVCIDSVSLYDTQLQPVSSLVAIPTSKLTIGNKSRRAIITEVITLDVTFVTFTDATISEHFTLGSIELNLNTRCSSAS